MTITLIILFIAIALADLVLYRDTHRFIVREYEIGTDLVNEDVTVAVIADLHGKDYGDDNKELIDAIDAISPDIILSPGDLVTSTSHDRGRSEATALKLMTELASRYPVAVSSGNHEYRTMNLTEKFGDRYERYEKGLKDAGVHVLHNDTYVFEDMNIAVTGLEILFRYYKRGRRLPMEESWLRETIGEPVPGRYNIMLAHNPVYFEEYALRGADLVLSGHLHGGLVRLPGLGGMAAPDYHFFPKYDGGIFTAKDGRTRLIVSRGLGTHTLHIRFNNPGELVVVRLKKNGRVRK